MDGLIVKGIQLSWAPPWYIGETSFLVVKRMLNWNLPLQYAEQQMIRMDT